MQGRDDTVVAGFEHKRRGAAMGIKNMRAICPNCGGKIATQARGLGHVTWMASGALVRTGTTCQWCGVALTGRVDGRNRAIVAPHSGETVGRLAGGDRAEVSVLEDGTEITRHQGDTIFVFADGTQMTEFADGGRLVEGTDGASVFTGPDGYEVATNANGTTLITETDGTQIMIRLENGKEVTSRKAVGQDWERL